MVSGIAACRDMKKVGRVGAKLSYISKWSLRWRCLIGIVVGKHRAPRHRTHVKRAKSRRQGGAVADNAGAAKAQSVTEFLMQIFPLKNRRRCVR